MKKIFLNRTIILLIILFLSLDWLILPVPFTSKAFAFMGLEVILPILLISEFKNVRQIIKQDKLVARLILVFGVYFFSTLIFKVLKWEFDFEYFSYFRIFFMICEIYYLMRIKYFKKENIINGFTLFFTVMNLSQLIHFLTNHSLRTSEIAININIYICFIMMSLPFFIKNLNNSNKYLSIVSFINLILASSLIPYSGSRLAFVMMIITLTFMTVYLFKFYKSSLVKIAKAFLVSLMAICISFFTIADNYGKAAIYRFTMFDKIFNIENDDLRKKPIQQDNLATDNNENKPSFPETNNGESKPSSPGDGDNENKPSFPETNNNENKPSLSGNDNEYKNKEMLVHTSDILRYQLWDDAIKIIKDNFWLGRGIVTLTYNHSGVVYQQSPHNFILELLLNYGFIGMVVVLITYVVMLTRYFKFKLKNVLNFIPSILNLFCFLTFSLFQPTFYSYICILIFMLLSVLYEEYS